MTSVIQEIVNQTGWIYSNALVIYLLDSGSSTNARRAFTTYEGAPANAAKLVITYTASAPTASSVSATYGSYSRAGPNNTPWTLNFTGANGITTYQVRTGSTVTTGTQVVAPAAAADGANAKTIAYNATGLVDGSQTLYLYVSNDSGSTWSAGYSFTLLRDDTAPTASTAISNTPTTVGSNKQYTVTFTPHDAASTNAGEMAYQIRDAAGGAGNLLASGTCTSGSALTTGTVTDSALTTGGTYTRYVRTRDGANNWTDTSWTFTYSPVVAANLTLQSVGGVAAATATVSTSAMLAPSAAAGVASAGNLTLAAPGQIVPSAVAGVASVASLLLQSPALLSISSAGVATVSDLLVQSISYLALSAPAGVATASAAVTTFSGLLLLQAIAGAATASLSPLTAPALLALSSMAGLASAVLDALITPARLAFASLSGTGTAQVVVISPALLTLNAAGAATALAPVSSPVFLSAGASSGSAATLIQLTTPVLLAALHAAGIGNAQLAGLNFPSIRAVLAGGRVSFTKTPGGVVTYLHIPGAVVTSDGKLTGAGIIIGH